MAKNKLLKIQVIKASGLQDIYFTLNGKQVSCKIKPSMVLLDLIRNEFQFKGTKPGCYEGECGACTVLVNGLPINSCLYLAVNVNGKKIITIEGLAEKNGSLDPVQEALISSGAIQCGFCTSGIAMNIKALLNHFKKKRKPSQEEIKKWLEGNLCRCTGYTKIIEATEKLLQHNY